MPLYENVLKGKYNAINDESYSKELKEIVSKCLNPNPE